MNNISNMEIEQPTDDEKIVWMKWVESLEEDSDIAQCAREIYQFFETSCLLTAAVIRKKLTNKLNWSPSYQRLTNDFVKQHHLFQIEFGFPNHDVFDEHIMTICCGVIYQSFWKKTAWDVRPLLIPDNFDLTDEGTVSLENAEKVIGFTLNDPDQNGSMKYRILIPTD